MLILLLKCVAHKIVAYGIHMGLKQSSPFHMIESIIDKYSQMRDFNVYFANINYATCIYSY